MLGQNHFVKNCLAFLAMRAGYIQADALAEAAEERLTDLLAQGVSFVGFAIDGGPLDYAGRIYRVGGQECLVRLFDYTDDHGTAHVVVRSDGYQRILDREGNDNHLSRMKLGREVDRLIKTALKTYIARSYRTGTGKGLVLNLD